jgi:hypothetical protein
MNSLKNSSGCSSTPCATAASLRDAWWREIRGKLNGTRVAVYRALATAGEPLTTDAIADRSGISLLTVRPRVTELCQVGLAEFVDRTGHHGRYRAIPIRQACRHHLVANAPARQQELGFSLS